MPVKFRYFLIAFLLAGVWSLVTTEIAALWYYVVINALLHNSVRTIDEQPRWSAALQMLIAYSDWIALLVSILHWGVKRRQWLVPLGFFLGIVVVYIYVFVTFSMVMRNFN